MSKANDKSEPDEDLELFDEADEMDSDLDLDVLEDDVVEAAPRPNGKPVTHGSSRRASARLETKRRLDAYLERKWFRDHGWDDDDELFKDDFFTDSSSPVHQHA